MKKIVNEAQLYNYIYKRVLNELSMDKMAGAFQGQLDAKDNMPKRREAFAQKMCDIFNNKYGYDARFAPEDDRKIMASIKAGQLVSDEDKGLTVFYHDVDNNIEFSIESNSVISNIYYDKPVKFTICSDNQDRMTANSAEDAFSAVSKYTEDDRKFRRKLKDALNAYAQLISHLYSEHQNHLNNK